jgi:drug/metabolite transporter (DMT)-like permease
MEGMNEIASRGNGGAARIPALMNILLLALVPACFALNPVIGRALADAFGPASLSVVRWSLSTVVVALLALMRKGQRWHGSTSHWFRVGVLGALGMGFCSYAAFEGARTSPATNIALIYGCASAFVAAWEIAAGRQRATLSLAFGIAACLTGVVLIMTRGHPQVLQDLTFTPGDLWAAAGMLAFVVYTVALRRAPELLTALPQFTVMSCAATLALLPFAVVELTTAAPTLAAWTWPWLAAVVLITSIGAFLGYNTVLALNGPVLTSAAMTLVPVYAASLAMVLIGEQLAWYHAAALALVVAGLLLVNWAQAADLGRGRELKTDPSTQYAFKTPTLRSVALRPPYMHNVSSVNLHEVIRHYEKGGIDRPSHSPLMTPVQLSEQERHDLVAFMQTLTDTLEGDVPPQLPGLDR